MCANHTSNIINTACTVGSKRKGKKTLDKKEFGGTKVCRMGLCMWLCSASVSQRVGKFSCFHLSKRLHKQNFAFSFPMLEFSPASFEQRKACSKLTQCLSVESGPTLSCHVNHWRAIRWCTRIGRSEPTFEECAHHHCDFSLGEFDHVGVLPLTFCGCVINSFASCIVDLKKMFF